MQKAYLFEQIKRCLNILIFFSGRLHPGKVCFIFRFKLKLKPKLFIMKHPFVITALSILSGLAACNSKKNEADQANKIDGPKTE